MRPHRRVLASNVVPRIGLAAGFTAASSQKLEIASNASLQIPAATPITLAAWVYPTAAGSYRRIAGKGDGAAVGTDDYFLQIAFLGGVNQWEFGVSSGAAYQVQDWGAGSPAALNQWTFVCGQFRPSDGFIGMQVNGTFASGSKTAADVNRTTKAFALGAVGSGVYWDGRIDAVGLWTRLLTNGGGNEIDQLYNAGVGRRYATLPAGLKTGLVSWWDLDDSGSTWLDANGANNLTNFNGVQSVVGQT